MHNISGLSLLLLAGSVHAQVMCGSWQLAPPIGGWTRAVLQFQGSTYVAGGFYGPSGNYITRFTGAGYDPLPHQPTAAISTLVAHDSGTGPELYAGGAYWIFPPIVTYFGVIRWNGNAWTGTGYPNGQGEVTDFAVFDDGAGPRLFAAASAGPLRSWNGAAWSEVPGSPNDIRSLAVFDGGTGAALFVGGKFTSAGGVVAKNIARYRAGEWSEAGGGLWYSGFGSGEYVSCLEALDLGQGQRLFAGGMFNRAGELPVRFVASWDGAVWTAYPFTGYNTMFVSAVSDVIETMAVLEFDGKRLLLAGSQSLSSQGGALKGGLLVWDGERWSGTGGPGEHGVVAILPIQEAGNERVLTAGALGGAWLAEWHPGSLCYANCDCSTASPALNVADFSCFLQRFAEGNMWANCDASTTAPVLNVADFACFLQRFAAGCP